jgi:hypothetical protein
VAKVEGCTRTFYKRGRMKLVVSFREKVSGSHLILRRLTMPAVWILSAREEAEKCLHTRYGEVATVLLQVACEGDEARQEQP